MQIPSAGDIRHGSCIVSASNIALQEIRARKKKLADSFVNEHYRDHSRQLANALQRWVQGLRFTTCDYRDGQLLFRNVSERIEAESVEYIEYLKKHLNKILPTLLSAPGQIESEHKRICADIEKIISSTSIVPGKPPYERIIIDKIKIACPGLIAMHDITLTQNDIYLNKYLFAIIFETVKRQETKISLTIEPPKSDIKRLVYEGQLTLAQGSEGNVTILKRTIEELIQDELIKQRVNEYEDLADKLKNDPKVRSLEEFATEMRTQINGGRILGGYPACDLCDPDKPVDLQPRI